MPQYSLIWEGESTAVKLNISVQNKKIDLDIEPGIEEISPVHIERHEMSYDIDYYTLQNTLRGQLNITEWLSQAYHVIKRDHKNFIGL